jgi:transcriptional regulator with XRE-family HTH domain
LLAENQLLGRWHAASCCSAHPPHRQALAGTGRRDLGHQLLASFQCALAIRFLRFRVGGWQPLADALGVKADSLSKVLRGARDVTARLAYGVARLTDVSIDGSRARCCHRERARCGRPPDDFADEETVVEDRPRETVLRVVRAGTDHA